MPYDSETLVSSHPKEEVLYYLNRVTREVNYLDKRSQEKSEAVFNGIVGQNGFRISKVVDRSDTFLPLLLGKIEDTPRGSIIFIDYKLFPGALFFLIFWTVVLSVFTVLYAFVIPNYTYAIICGGLGFINYFLAIYFFNRQVKSSRKLFHQLINFQMKD